LAQFWHTCCLKQAQIAATRHAQVIELSGVAVRWVVPKVGC